MVRVREDVFKKHDFWSWKFLELIQSYWMDVLS